MVEVLVSQLLDMKPPARGAVAVLEGGTPRPGVYHFSGGRTFRQMESPQGIYWEAEDDPNVVVVLVDDFKPYVAAVRGGPRHYDMWSEHGDLTTALERAARLCDGNEQ